MTYIIKPLLVFGKGKDKDMVKKCINEKRIFHILFIFLAIFMMIYVVKKEYLYAEIDSYILPAISIQYKGTVVISQEDIDKAREEFPDLYKDIYTYEDLRASKLLKIDEEHWMPFYFPTYALLALPIKLLMQICQFNQSKAFGITNVILNIFALYYFFVIYKRKLGFFHASFWALFLFINPILLYYRYISAECTLFSLVLLSMVLWSENKYKKSALLISIASTMNPTVMGIGIFLFIDYALLYLKNNKGNLFQKNNMLDVVKLVCCYIPSLIPFLVNFYYLGAFFPISKYASAEGLFTRFLAYIFDLNLGVASISIILVLLFIASMVYSLYKKEWKIFIQSGSVLFTIFLFSITHHINSGMLNCARYVIWIYPAFLLVIINTANLLFQNKKMVYSFVLAICFAFQFILLAYNGFYGPREFNKLSKLILNNYPQWYINICPSTFNCRVNDIDGAYEINDVVIYTSEKTGEVRKILFFNNEENYLSLLGKIGSEEDENLSKLKEKLDSFDKEKFYYINIDKNAEVQYYLTN